MPVTTWSTEVTYRSAQDETRTVRVLHKSKADALKHYRRMERNPTQVTTVRLFCWSGGRERLLAESQGYLFNDDIPFSKGAGSHAHIPAPLPAALDSAPNQTKGKGKETLV